MRLLGFYICLALHASGVFGSKRAGPYQGVLYFLIYRMDVQAFGSGNTAIAADCFGSLPDKSCTFDEFLKYVSPHWQGSTSVGTSLSPDVEKTARELKSSGYQGGTDLIKMFGPNAGLDPNNKKPFAEIVTMLGDDIDACRQEEGDPKLGTLLSKARTCIGMVHKARSADQAAALIKGVNNVLEAELKRLKKPVFTVHTTVSRFSLFDWNMIDTTTTLERCSNCGPQLQHTIARYIREFATEPGTNARHNNVVQAFQEQEGRLDRAPGC